MATSTAISLDRISRVVGYKLKPADFGINTPNLPQRIAILGEANSDNQATLSEDPFEFINSQEVGKRYGYGSPLHLIARILRPVSGGILGGVKTEIYPQTSDGAATAAVYKLGIALAGTNPTKNTTHTLRINGRTSVDGQSYSYTVTTADTLATLQAKIVDAISGVLAAPVTAVENADDVDITSKWKGATAKLTIEVETNGVDAGITYSEVSNTDGTGAVDISTALAKFGSKWNTLVINPYGVSTLSDLEFANGIPDPDAPTGRYNSTEFKPFVALFGNTSKVRATVEAITDAEARKTEVTNVLCPAPGSEGFDFEAAANMAATTALLSTNSPHLGNGGKQYPDMPIPSDGDIGDFADYNSRDALAKAGSSTVNLVNGKYTVQDFQTTYHPDGELPAKFRKVRDLILNWNIQYRWRIIMLRSIQDKAITQNDAAVRVADTTSPKQVKQLLYSFYSDLANDALVADTEFSENSTLVNINESNPARLDIFFRYKITSTADIASTDVEFDFYYNN